MGRVSGQHIRDAKPHSLAFITSIFSALLAVVMIVGGSLISAPFAQGAVSTNATATVKLVADKTSANVTDSIHYVLQYQVSTKNGDVNNGELVVDVNELVSATGARLDDTNIVEIYGNNPSDATVDGRKVPVQIIKDAQGRLKQFKWALGTVPSGTASQVSFDLKVKGGTITNGSKLDVIGRFTGIDPNDGNSDVIAAPQTASTVFKNELLKLELRKTYPSNTLPAGGTGPVRVTYALYVDSLGGPGRGLMSQNIRVTDIIPAGGRYVTSTIGNAAGFEKSAAEALTPTINGQEVTWSFGKDLVYAKYREADYSTVFKNRIVINVTVEYDAATAVVGNTVTNNAKLTADEPNGPSYTSTGSVNHGFAKVSAAGTISKVVTNWISPLPDGGYDNRAVGMRTVGESGTYILGFANRGNIDQSFSAEDYLPSTDTLASPTDGSKSLPNPAMKDVSLLVFSDGSQPAGYTMTVDYTTHLGQNGTVTVTPQAGITPKIDLPVSAGDWVSYLKVRGTIPAATNVSLRVVGVLQESITKKADGSLRTEDDAQYRDGVPPTDKKLASAISPDRKNEYMLVQNTMTNAKMWAGANEPATGGAYSASMGVMRLVPNPSFTKNMVGVYSNGRVTSATPNTGDTVVFGFVNIKNLSKTEAINPTVTDLLPYGMTFEGVLPEATLNQYGSKYYYGGTRGALKYDQIKTETRDVVKDGVTRQAVSISWKDNPMIVNADGGAGVYIMAKITPKMKGGTNLNEAYLSWVDAAGNPGSTVFSKSVGEADAIKRDKDTLDVNGNGNTQEAVMYGSAPITIASNPDATVTKEVKGNLDADFKENPAIGTVEHGRDAQYRITVTNSGNVDLNEYRLYDILPYPGDTWIANTSKSRGSNWSPVVTGELTAATEDGVALSDFDVLYTTNTNPVRPELSNPAGTYAANSDWKSWNDIADKSTIKGFRLALKSDKTFKSEAKLVVTLPVNAPNSAVGIAWNSIAHTYKAASSPWSLPADVKIVGLTVPSDVELYKTIVDTNGQPFGPNKVFKGGEEVLFYVTVRNNGTGVSTGAKVMEKLPEGLTYVSHEIHTNVNAGQNDKSVQPTPILTGATAGSYDPTTGVWEVTPAYDGTDEAKVQAANANALLAGGASTLIVRARIGADMLGKVLTNSVEITSSDQGDNDKSNNKSSVSLTTGYAISGTLYNDPARAYSLTDPDAQAPIVGVTVVLLDGNGTEVDRVVTDADGGYEFRGIPAGTYNVKVLEGAGTPLEGLEQTEDPDQPGVKPTTADGKLTTAVIFPPVTADNANDPNIVRERTGVNFGFVALEDLKLVKSVESPAGAAAQNVRAGDSITYKVTLTNEGVLLADGTRKGVPTSGVKVKDQLPADLEFVSATADSGSYDQATGVWTVGDGVEVGSSVSLTIVAKLKASGAGKSVTNVAEISASDHKDVDSTPGNNTPNEDDQSSATIKSPLSISGNVYYDANKSNTGDAGETKVSGVTVILRDNDGNEVARTTTDADGNYTFGDLTPGKFEVEVVPSGRIANSDNTQAHTTTDAYKTDKPNKTPVTLTTSPATGVDFGYIDPADLSVIKKAEMADGTPVAPGYKFMPGDEFVYSLTVTNNGTGSATDVRVTDQLPAGVVYVSDDAGHGSYDAATGVWTVVKPLAEAAGDTLPANSSYVLRITVRVADGQYVKSVVNTATVASNDQPDHNESNNKSSATVSTGTKISGTLYHDGDASFTKSSTEDVYSGVTVELLDPEGNVVATTTTKPDGSYEFDRVVPGAYTVTVVPNDDIKDLKNTQAYEGKNSLNVPVVITENPVENVDFGFVKPASVGNYVWADRNRDGIQDPSEQGIQNVVVILRDANGDEVARRTTDANGFYRFDNLYPAQYELEFIQPAGWMTSPENVGSDMTKNSRGLRYAVVLSEGDANVNVNSGFFDPNVPVSTDTVPAKKRLARTGAAVEAIMMVVAAGVLAGIALVARRKMAARR